MRTRMQEISKDSWKKITQTMELKIWENSMAKEDKNNWWAQNFNNYINAVEEPVDSIIEMGCGPFAKNIQIILNILKHKPTKIMLNDPLLQEYINLNKPVKNFIEKNKIETFICPLEECVLPSPVDMLISINVLDHVYNLKNCLNSILNNLKPSGILILGNDLTNDKNFKDTPTDDPNAMLHPIRFDYSDIEYFLDKFDSIYKKISDPQGFHCGTLFFIGRKYGS